MADELIDIFDENNKPLNIKKMKSEAHTKGLWHRGVNIWVYNSKKEILLQLRAKDKLIYPDVWDVSSAGHIGAGEKVIDAAIRETEEELGLKVTKKELNFLKVKKFKVETKSKLGNTKNNEFINIYLLKFDGDIKKLKIQKEELQKIKFIGVDKLENELNSKIKCKKYPPQREYWLETINEIRKAK